MSDSFVDSPGPSVMVLNAVAVPEVHVGTRAKPAAADSARFSAGALRECASTFSTKAESACLSRIGVDKFTEFGRNEGPSKGVITAAPVFKSAKTRAFTRKKRSFMDPKG